MRAAFLLVLSMACASAAMAGPDLSAPGAKLFVERCLDCHDSGDERAPTIQAMSLMPTDRVVTALKTGPMQTMAAGMSDDDIKAVAAYLATLKANP